MHTILFTHLSANDIIRAICRTLVHSLWQGLLLAVLGGIIVLYTKSRGPALRYNLLATAFILFLISSFATFIMQLHPSQVQVATALVATGNSMITANSSFTNYIVPYFNTLLVDLSSYVDKHSTLIVAGWLLIFIARLVKVISGLSYIHYIRHHQTQAPAESWRKRIHELKTILKINETVLLLESAIVQVPSAIGWLKPVILFPIGLLTRLPANQVEAILLHELAHIKRRDYFLNLVQSFAEMIFFFHPAVLWISSLMREERENCCDDMAITITKSKSQFVHALVTFQEYNKTSGYAMTFPGKKNLLLNRAKRILCGNNSSLDPVEKAFILSCCFVISLLTIMAGPTSVKESFSKMGRGIITTPHLSTPRAESRLVMERPAVKLNPALIRSSLPRKKQTTKKNVINERTDTVPTKKDISVSIKGVTVSTTTITNYTPHVVLRYDSTYLPKQNRIKITTKIKLAPLQKLIIRTPVLETYLPYQPVGPSSAPSPRATKSSQPARETRSRPDPVIADLIPEKIISELVVTNKADLSYSLSNDVLIVQGVKQPDAAFIKLRSKYIIPGKLTTLYYNWKN